MNNPDSLIKSLNLAENYGERKQQHYRLTDYLMDSLSDLVFHMSLPEGRYEYVNPSAQTLTGYTSEEFYQTPRLIWTIVHPEWQNALQQQWEALLQGIVPEEWEFPILHKSGDIRWLRQRNVLIPNSEGYPFYLLGTVTDISEKKKSEELLQERIESHSQPIPDEFHFQFQDLFDLSEIQRIQDIFSDATGVASIITTPDGHPITRPSNFCHLCRDVIRKTEKGLQNCIRSDALLGRPNAKGPIMQPCYSCGLWDGGASLWVGNRHIANWLIGQVRNDDLDMEGMRRYAHEIGADETEFMEALSEVTVMSTGQFEKVCQALFLIANQLSQLAYRNIQQAHSMRQRQKVEDALRESETLYSSLVESLPQCIFRKDLQNRYIFMNQQCCNFLRLDKKDILGKTDHDLFPKDLADQYRDGDRWVIENAQNFEAIEQYQAPGEAKRYIQVQKSPLYNAEGSIIGVLGLFFDITEKYKMEEEITKVRTLESVGLLAGGIAHDFNNILTAVIGNISLVKHLSDPQSQVLSYLHEAEQASLKAQKLTQQLLTFSKGGAPIRETASIEEIVKDTTIFILRGSSIQYSFDPDPNLWLVDVDKGQFSQVIQNLVLNAKQAMPEGGVLEVKMRNVQSEAVHPVLRSGDYVSISIHDSGCGIPKDYLPKIFTPYFTTKSQGNGLGLAIAYSILSKHGGTITVESKPNQGTTFTLYLPASEKQDRLPHQDALADRPLVGKGRILFMDDEEMVRKVARSMLQQLGYQTTLARDGQEAIDLYQESLNKNQRFDAVIMDLTVPGGMGGKSAIRILREIDDQVVAIVSSGYSQDLILAEYQKYGFRNIIQKPYRAQELGQVLQQVLEYR